jgi:hypothetical protein
MIPMRKIRIRLLFTFAALLILSMSAKGQDADSTTVYFEQDSIAKYLTPMEYAFMMHEQTRFMLRLPAIGLGAEVELLPYITLMAESTWNAGRLDFYSELRWHYGSHRMKVRNMSGNYIATGIFYNGFWDERFYARWGMQRRFLSNGFIDLGLLVGYSKGNNPERINAFTDQGYFSFETAASLGLGFVFNKSQGIDRDRVCTVVKCYEVERFLLKINMNDLARIWYAPSQSQFIASFSPSIALEQKLFNSAFSINIHSAINIGASNSFDNLGNQGQNDFLINRFELIGEGRWYYNMKRRMLNGKGGNGLSANYLAVGARQQFFEYLENSRDFQPGYIITTGVQRTIGNRFYFDVQGGIAEDVLDREDGPVEFILDIRAGIKF